MISNQNTQSPTKGANVSGTRVPGKRTPNDTRPLAGRFNVEAAKAKNAVPRLN
jgi:hypothetical protein